MPHCRSSLCTCILLASILWALAWPAAAQPSQRDLVLPAGVGDGPVVRALRLGEFELAAQQAEEQLRRRAVLAEQRHLAMRDEAPPEQLRAIDRQLGEIGTYARLYYLLGCATLMQAQDDRARMLDAGLHFARSLLLDSRGRFAGPAMVELGHVHQRIGAATQARHWFDRAALLLRPEEDPAYHQRLNTLRDRGR